MNRTFDYDLHGLAGVRLLNAYPEDIAGVSRQLGPIEASLTREPDIVIRFVDSLPDSSTLRYIGLDDAGFTDDAFLVLRSRHKSRTKVRIPFETIGSQCEILCEHGTAGVPLLIPILNLTILGKGTLPLHAAAFIHQGRGVVVTGWSKGGKTETLLAFMAQGARYVGDEWVYLTPDGKRMVGIPEPIRVWSWHFGYLPRYRTLLTRSKRLRLYLLDMLAGGLERFTTNGTRHPSSIMRVVNRIKPLVKKQCCLDLQPERLFEVGGRPYQGTPDTFVFVASHDSPEVSVRPLDPQEIARRMVFSLQEEQMPFMSYYWRFRFAFPELSNDLIEHSRDLQRQALDHVLDGKEAFEMLHPYPVDLMSLFKAMKPSLGGD